MKRPVVIILTVISALVVFIFLMVAYIAHQVSSSEIQERIFSEFNQVFPRGNLSVEKIEVKYGTTINVQIANLAGSVKLKTKETYPLFSFKKIIINRNLFANRIKQAKFFCKTFIDNNRLVFITDKIWGKIPAVYHFHT